MKLDNSFKTGGLLANAIQGFYERAEQTKLGELVQHAIKQQQALVVEAGTGVGKTYGYLVPAILSGKKIIISTGTKNLQEQLYFKDLPLLLKALNKSRTKAILKGRANYLCLHAIHNVEYSATNTVEKKKLKKVNLIKEHIPMLLLGDINELPDIREDDEIWRDITSTSENCLGTDCEYYQKCFLNKARKKALDAELVVINHHLFFADSVLKEEGFAEILPSADVVIFDEAHQLPQIGTNFFGEKLSSRQLALICHELKEAQLELANDDADLLDYIVDLKKKANAFSLALKLRNERVPWHRLVKSSEILNANEALFEACFALKQHLERVAIRSKAFEQVLKRITNHISLLQDLQNESINYAHWIEIFNDSFAIHKTPLSIHEAYQAILNSNTTYIYVSATLSVNAKLTYFMSELGINDAKTAILDSPFCYETQALFYFPRGLPKPQTSSYNQIMFERTLPIISSLNGRTFFLFTSIKAMKEAQIYFEKETSLKVFVQGQMPKLQLLDSFASTDNAILLGSYSFWEGVDVKGPTLSCVIIDRLPFESPSCPILQARAQIIKSSGGSAFASYQLPHAVIVLKQGLGRLIRSKHDKGILVVCDPRLAEKAYGADFFNSLYALKKTRSEQIVLEFIQNQLLSMDNEVISH